MYRVWDVHTTHVVFAKEKRAFFLDFDISSMAHLHQCLGCQNAVLGRNEIVSEQVLWSLWAYVPRLAHS